MIGLIEQNLPFKHFVSPEAIYCSVIDGRQEPFPVSLQSMKTRRLCCVLLKIPLQVALHSFGTTFHSYISMIPSSIYLISIRPLSSVGENVLGAFLRALQCITTLIIFRVRYSIQQGMFRSENLGKHWAAVCQGCNYMCSTLERRRLGKWLLASLSL